MQKKKKKKKKEKKKKNAFYSSAIAQKILNDLHFSTCFKTHSHAALVKYSGYLVLSSAELGNKKYQKIPKKSTNFYKNPLCGSFTAAEMFP